MNDVQRRLVDHFRAHPPEGVLSAYLFGSHAEGRAHRESDVDVGVLLDREIFPSLQARGRVREWLGSELIEVLGKNEVDVVILNDVSPELGRAVVVRGIRVLCANPEADHAFVRDVQLQAADLALFLDRMRRIKLEALRR